MRVALFCIVVITLLTSLGCSKPVTEAGTQVNVLHADAHLTLAP